MLIDFNKIQEHTISEMNGGTGEVTANVYGTERKNNPKQNTYKRIYRYAST